MITLLLAAVLALPDGAEAVRIGEDAWPEKVAELRVGERAWWWSRACAPQLLAGDAPSIQCTAPLIRRVLVLDRASGKKLPGARVIWGTDAMRGDLPDAMLPTAITDANGEALLALPDGKVSLRVDGPRVASWWQNVAPGDAATRVTAVPAAPAITQLMIEGSEPASRARLQLDMRGSTSDSRSWAIANDGRMTLPLVPPVPMLVTAWGDSSAPLTVDVDAAQWPRSIDLPRGAAIRGRIVDTRRRPIEGATIEGIVAVERQSRAMRRKTQSSRAGTFVLHGVLAAPTQLTIRKNGRATILRTIDAATDADAGDITLRNARRVALRLVDADRQPIANATARVTAGPSATSNRKGELQLDGVDAEDDLLVTINARGFRSTELTLAAEETDLREVVLSRGVRVIGNVVDASGGSAGPGDVLVNNNGAQRVVAFDETGSIDIGGLDAGKLALEIRSKFAAPLAIASRTVVDEETWDLGILQLDEGARLAGRIVDRDGGAPIADAHVRVLRRTGADSAIAAAMNDWITVSADDDGSFVLRGLDSQPRTAIVDAPGFASRLVDVTASTERLEIALDRARALVIDCTPVRRCGSEARLLYAGAQHPWASTSATMREGRARILSAAPGTATLRLTDAGQVVHEREIRISNATETNVHIELLTATLQGSVVTAGRPRRDGGMVELRARTTPSAALPIFIEQRTADGFTLNGGWQSELPSMQMAPVDDSGSFLFAELEPGQYHAVYRRDGKSSQSTPVLVTPGTSRLVLDVAPGELRGRVLQSDGSGATFAQVVIIDATGARSTILTDRLGVFEAFGIAEGRARVIATNRDTAASTEVVVDGMRPAIVEMILHPPAAGERR